MAAVEARPTCDCVSRSPTFPLYRDTIHLPDCVWFWFEKLERDFSAYRRATDQKIERLIRRVTALEAAAPATEEVE